MSAQVKDILPQFSVVAMRAEHIAGAVRLHRESFPNEPLGRLGPGVATAVYRTYVDSPRCISFVAVSGDKVVGAVNGVIGAGFMKEVVRRHWLLVGSAVTAQVLRSPRLALELATITKRGSDPWGGDTTRRFYWRTQMTDAAWRGRGIILPLVRALLSEARRRGAWEACSTAADQNLAAVWVHKVLGFESRVVGPGPRHYRLKLDRLPWDRAEEAARY